MQAFTSCMVYRNDANDIYTKRSSTVMTSMQSLAKTLLYICGVRAPDC